MENQPLRPEGGVRAQALPAQCLPELTRNGPIRDYRTIQREPGLIRQIRRGNETQFCAPMTKFMLILSITLTGTILLVLFVLLASEFSNHIEKEYTPRTTDVPKYY